MCWLKPVQIITITIITTIYHLMLSQTEAVPAAALERALLTTAGSFTTMARANLTCGNTQGPNLFTQNLQWHNPITQLVIGPFRTVQPCTGSVSHNQPSSLPGNRLAA
ncbi:unnamed protein product [Pleuronectes platessa]|uniref:Uncharacterized protein n=1 Tax=Pleuronectes platessa TaxID=8262 RepID=A0A9N7UHL2_PLEPL|nr:unnamed protein product [Pleuronectes platessa]